MPLVVRTSSPSAEIALERAHRRDASLLRSPQQEVEGPDHEDQPDDDKRHEPSPMHGEARSTLPPRAPPASGQSIGHVEGAAAVDGDGVGQARRARSPRFMATCPRYAAAGQLGPPRSPPRRRGRRARRRRPRRRGSPRRRRRRGRTSSRRPSPAGMARLRAVPAPARPPSAGNTMPISVSISPIRNVAARADALVGAEHQQRARGDRVTRCTRRRRAPPTRTCGLNSAPPSVTSRPAASRPDRITLRSNPPENMPGVPVMQQRADLLSPASSARRERGVEQRDHLGRRARSPCRCRSSRARCGRAPRIARVRHGHVSSRVA